MSHRVFLPAAAAAALLAALATAAIVPPARADAHAAHSGPAAHAAMTDDAMRRLVDDWFASHPRRGTPSALAANATFTVTNFRFDLDGNAGTQVDTAKIVAGETVTWQWVLGIHTITSGEGTADPEAGALFNQPSTTSNRTFTFQFDTPGTYHFFCAPHEFNAMRGVVLVSSSTGIGDPPFAAHGFTRDPAPNPSRESVRFAFALRSGGRARAEVFDARGRRVARVLDRELEAGAHEAAWNGRGADGAPARAGVYYVRLRLPGYSDTRSVVLIR